jgi:acyl-CoA dehydrogenase
MPATDPRIALWRTLNTTPEADPIAGMAEAGLLLPEPSYAAIAATKAALAAATGLLGVGAAWGGRQLVYRHFVAGFGTDAQRAAYADKTVAVAISEPKVGAHPKLLTTRAVVDGDRVSITGEKAYVSNGPSADAILVFAVTAEEAGRKRYGAFLVPRDAPGVTFNDANGFHALRPSRHCGMRLDAVRVDRASQLGPEGSAYERMALPFRDVEDAVGTMSLVGAFRFLLPLLAGADGEGAALSLGGLVALTAVYETAARAVVAALDAGALDHSNATLVGSRVLAGDIVARIRAHLGRFAPLEDKAVAAMLADIDAVLGIARGPRDARQARLAVALNGLAAPHQSV